MLGILEVCAAGHGGDGFGPSVHRARVEHFEVVAFGAAGRVELAAFGEGFAGSVDLHCGEKGGGDLRGGAFFEHGVHLLLEGAQLLVVGAELEAVFDGGHGVDCAFLEVAHFLRVFEHPLRFFEVAFVACVEGFHGEVTGLGGEAGFEMLRGFDEADISRIFPAILMSGLSASQASTSWPNDRPSRMA